MQKENKYTPEVQTEPIPRHPESFSLVALRRKMAEVAMEKRSPFDEKQTEVIPVVDESKDSEEVPVSHQNSDPKKPTPKWIQTIDRVNGR
ncbi:hypothetical protein KC953_02890 [Candidatus Saccharibacteria bacterium]|nr:hypothetical protein [Candidatus Saccharibacteria bacterium]